jgi:hypothetical protein
VKWLEAQAPPPRAPERREGATRVTASFEEGSAVLAGPDGEVTLAFGAGRPESVLPPATYRVRTTRIARENFLISSVGKPEPALVVEASGKDAVRLEVLEAVRFEGHAKRDGRKLQLGFSIKGADGRGLSVYKDGKRVPVTYKVRDANGAVLAEGTMSYG